MKFNPVDVVVSVTGFSRSSREPEVTLEGSKIRRIKVYHGRLFQIHGRLKDYQDKALRWQVSLKEWRVSPPNLISKKSQRKRNRFMLLLVNRVSFNRQPEIISIYLPLTLGQKRYLSLSGHLFMETGIAHLLTISGLRIIMIYGMLYLKISLLFEFRGKFLERVNLNYLI